MVFKYTRSDNRFKVHNNSLETYYINLKAFLNRKPFLVSLNDMNDLFNTTNEKDNLLPKDGTVYYYGKIYTNAESTHLFNKLLETIEWKNDEAAIYGKRIITARKVAWYGNDSFSYTYSGATKKALIWTKELIEIKHLVESKTGITYNSCLLNLYHNGNEGMAWHSDDEKSLGKNTNIASLSFGAERTFAFKHKETKEVIKLVLEHGSLLVMKDETQSYWKHRLLTTTKITRARINLTFRTIIE